MITRKRAPISVEQIAALIRDRIKYGTLVPGQRIVEADVTDQTGATRTRVRYALLHLATEGLVTIKRFKGASVTRLSREEVINIYRAREAVEGMATRLAAEAELSNQQKQQLNQLQSRLNTSKDLAHYLEANDDYHSHLIALSGNEHLVTFATRLRLPIFRLQLQIFAQRSSATKRSNHFHRQITDAVLTGHADSAEKLMREHVRDALEHWMSFDDPYFAPAPDSHGTD